MPSNLTQFQKEELIFGFIHESTNHNIPVALIKLCLSYFETVFYWIIRGKQLKKYLNTKFKNAIISKPYFYNNIACNLEIYPNGLFPDMSGDVSLFIRPHLPSNIQYIETTLKFIFNDTIKTTTYKLFDHENNTDWGWTDWCLLLSECNKYNQLSFAVDMNILYIKYKDNKLYKPLHFIKMCKEFKKEWIINEDIINEFKNYKCGKIYQSETCGLGNNFCLACFPNGACQSQKESLIFGVNVIQIYHKIAVIGMYIVLKENEKGIECNAEIEFEPVADGASYYWGMDEFKTKWLNDVSLLHFSVLMNVKYIIDKDGNEIAKDQWNLYGIVD
eukprot:323000_1